ELVEGKGEYALRGGILDVFPPDSAQPYRVELFGDEIDSIRTFNQDNQRSIEQVNSFDIFPAKELILTEEQMQEGAERIEKEFQSILKDKQKRKGYDKEAL